MFYVLVITAVGPFLINGVIIDWGFMPDQAKYFRQTQFLRVQIYLG